MINLRQLGVLLFVGTTLLVASPGINGEPGNLAQPCPQSGNLRIEIIPTSMGSSVNLADFPNIGVKFRLTEGSDLIASELAVSRFSLAEDGRYVRVLSEPIYDTENSSYTVTYASRQFRREEPLHALNLCLQVDDGRIAATEAGYRVLPSQVNWDKSVEFRPELKYLCELLILLLGTVIFISLIFMGRESSE